MTAVGATGAPVAPQRGGLGWHRDFRLLWIGQGTSSLGSSVTSVALPLVRWPPWTPRRSRVALLSAAAWLPWLLVGLGTMPVGALVGGVLAGAFGVRTAIWVTTGLPLTGLILLTGPIRRARDLPPQPAGTGSRSSP